MNLLSERFLLSLIVYFTVDISYRIRVFKLGLKLFTLCFICCDDKQVNFGDFLAPILVFHIDDRSVSVFISIYIKLVVIK